jgi:REP element-mobilizing transposase RayT
LVVNRTDWQSRAEFGDPSMTYLITFSCYGCHLHGSDSGSVDQMHNAPGTPMLDANLSRVQAETQRMDQGPYSLDQVRREVVMQAIQEVCGYRGWGLLAAHVRTTHVHVVVEAAVAPERVMADLKAYSSRSLNRMGVDEPGQKRWTRHGSTRWLWEPRSVSAAIQYVVSEQGDAMAVFEGQEG